MVLEESDNNGSSWTDVREADYNYYTGRVADGGGGWENDPNGRLGDLETAATTDPNLAKTLSSLTASSGTGTATTSSAHGYHVGDVIVIEGANEPEYNGVFVITSVTSTTFSFHISANAPSSATGTITTNKSISTDYYRYYKFTGESDYYASEGVTNGSAWTGGPDPYSPINGTYNPNSPSTYDDLLFSGLKTVVTGDAFNRLAAAYPDYSSATDTQVNAYANNYFQYERWADHNGTDGNPWDYFYAPNDYDANRNFYWRTGYRLGTRYRVTEEIAQGAGCSTCTGGQGTFKYEYVGNYPVFSSSSPSSTDVQAAGIGFETLDYNIWRMKTTEYLPDDTSTTWGDNDRNIIYTDEVGLPILTDLVDVSDTTISISDLSLSIASGVYTITATATAHGLGTGDVVAISGAKPDLLNGIFTITKINNDSFSFTVPANYFGTADGDWGYYSWSPAGDAITAAKVVSRTRTYYRYDDQGRLILKADPSAVVAQYDDSNDLINQPGTDESDLEGLSNATGLIETQVYYASTDATSTTAGGVAGYAWFNAVQQGEYGNRQATTISRSGTTATITLSSHGFVNGDIITITGASDEGYNGSYVISNVTTNTFDITVSSSFDSSATGYADRPIIQQSQNYFVRTVSGASTYPVASQTVYRNDDQSGSQTTSYDYTFFSGSFQPETTTVTYPTVGDSQNGPGTAATEVTYFDTYGEPIWTQDADGYINYTEYDPLTGAVVAQIQDVRS